MALWMEQEERDEQIREQIILIFSTRLVPLDPLGGGNGTEQANTRTGRWRRGNFLAT